MHGWRNVIAGLVAATLLMTAGVVAERGFLPLPEAPGPSGPSSLEAAPHDGPGARHSPDSHAPAAPPNGRIPSLQDALLVLERRESIVIRGDDAFHPANGVRSGAGTPDDPYVISGWFVDTVLIADTSRHFEFKENYVTRVLILDWTGEGAHAHHNLLANLRTNRNVERTGEATAGVVELNEIRRVEQLRHFDGVLARNVIGEADDLLRTERVILNIDGLKGARIHNNTIHGGVDLKIHGHHHGSCAECHSHNHGEGPQMEHDHTIRHVEFDFRDNLVKDTRFGLRYNDRNHAGDDRTAASEVEPTLEDPHRHHTTVRIVGNTLEGAGLRVDVMNAPDELHLQNVGHVLIEGNRVNGTAGGDGITVNDVRDATVVVRGNTVKREGLLASTFAGIHLQRFQNTTVRVEGNTFQDYRYGVRAHAFDADTTWIVNGNQAPGARYPVYWDDSVAHPPEGDGNARPAQPDPSEEGTVQALLKPGRRFP